MQRQPKSEAPHYQPILLSPETNALFPARLEGYKKHAALGGGTNSVFSIEHENTAQRLVLKTGAHDDAAKIEILCNAVYHALGVKVPAMRVYHTLPRELAAALGLPQHTGIFKLSAYLEPSTQQSEACIRATARQDFAAHVLLGNIDVAKTDNFIVDQQGSAHLIDAGANFLFRAQGAVRAEDASLASELDSLRNESINHRGHAWFADLTAAELDAQVSNLIAKHQAIEQTIWEVSSHLDLPEDIRHRFLEYISDRLDQLVVRCCRKSQRFAKTDKKAREGHTAAGVLTYAFINHEPHILLSKRAHHDWWDNFGGKSDAEDKYLIDTARREVAEESAHLLNFTVSELLASPCHDLVTGSGHEQFIYRMYICNTPSIDLKHVQDKEHTDHQWVSLRAVMAALQDTETMAVSCNGNDLPIFPPLATMLRQPAVYQNLQSLLGSGRLQATHTLGYANFNEAAVSEHRPLVTPVKKREDIAVTMTRKSSVMREIKSKSVTPAMDCQPLATMSLTQSEIHLQLLLGNKYCPGDLAANVRCFVKKYYSSYTAAKQEQLIHHAIFLLEKERSGGEDQFYFYHGCDNKIAFAYDVYTALYQALQANDDWTALRPDSQHFKRFTSMAEFIAFYSDHGKQHISNNAPHYNDCALSTNVFLFGNHETDSSNSIYYFTENFVTRPVDLFALFTHLLRPFHVSAGDIQRLLQLFATYRSQNGGSLYQISMSTEHARAMSYPAASGGVQNAWKGMNDITAIIPALLTEQSTSKAVEDYAQTLQARLLVPPHLPLHVTSVCWQDTTEEMSATYQQQLQQCVRFLLEAILRHHGSLRDDHQRTALLKILPSVLAVNQIPDAYKISDTVLARAIVTNDAETVRELLTDYPEFREKKIAVPRQYFKHNHAPEEMMHPLAMMLLRSDIRIDIIKEVYGMERYQAYLDNEIKSLADLRKIMPRLPESERSAVLLTHSHLVNSDFILCLLIELVPMAERMQFVAGNEADLIRASSLSTLLCIIPPSLRTATAKRFIGKIDNVFRLIDIIGHLPVEERMPFAIYMRGMIKDESVLRDIIRKLPADGVLEFAKSFAPAIDFAAVLPTVLAVMPEEKRLYVAISHNEYIKTFEDLSHILTILPLTDRRACTVACIIPPLSNGQLIYLACWLPASDRLNFIRQHQDMVYDLNSDESLKLLWALAELLPYEYRLPLVNTYQHLMRNGTHLSSLLEVLLPQDRNAFAQLHENLIDTVNALHLVLKELSRENRLPFVLRHQHLITDVDGLALIASFLKDEDILNFIKRHIDKIQTEEHIAGVKMVLPSSDFAEYEKYLREHHKLQPSKSGLFAPPQAAPVGWVSAQRVTQHL